MFLDRKDTILEKIKRYSESQNKNIPINIAVAFWGEGSELLIEDKLKYRIICNIKSGSSNPWTIEKIKKLTNVDIKHLDNLHAKVFISDTKAIVGSMNFSDNALGLKGQNNKGWIEAAYLCDRQTPNEWFMQLWESAELIKLEDIEECKNKFNAKDFKKNIYDIECSELFDLDFSKSREIIMASEKIKNFYFGDNYKENKNSTYNDRVKILAYAANIIWTMSGNSIPTKINHGDGFLLFKTPLDVLSRIMSLNHKSKINKTYLFIDEISKSSLFSVEVRYWAKKYIENFDYFEDELKKIYENI